MPRIADLPPEQRGPATEPARLASRFGYAKDRVRKIVDAEPPLTERQRAELACILLAPAEAGNATAT